MGLFNFIKRQLLEVVEWEDETKDTIVYRYPLNDREELMTSSTLVVRESQCAIFMHKGKICDVFGPGTYKLTTENIPFLTKILSLPTGFESRIKAEIYYVNTKQFIGQKWGTQNPIMMRDKDFGNVRLRGFGTYAFKVVDVKTFMEEVLGTNSLYKVSDIEENNKSLIVHGMSDALGEGKISALDLAGNYKEVSDLVKKQVNVEFLKLGMKLSNFIIENISLPEEVEKALDERTRLGIMEEKLDVYTKLKVADAVGDAAKNEGGGNFAGLGVGLGAGATLGRVFADTMSGNPNEKTAAAAKLCSCGAKNAASAKFCSECGKKFSKKVFCSNCGVEVKANAKFCSECGNKLG